ncbi:anti-sigma regulatory factor (Ser/Thr protein kinase) [Thermocatellispora tengchongensis]|uniref:Anti-sigma regulatory factor (Ser/Thr protein kinase) n=1 Tax=Thermocatellispora tengchongensis TaxID=1073253 RepID=A0A840P0Y2_9ACTN|nr:ATP-binding protein [Thermocatellispora tengchongensis]MBB5130917.1 anti-sigma regulatory factor (Ser/Thr protein kinase) [Thermocatellispora tengchongensis]
MRGRLCRYEPPRVISGEWWRQFPGTTISVPAAREWVRGLLAGRIAAALLDDISLLLTEVVANAVTHSDSGRTPDGQVAVRVMCGPDGVRGEVSDAGSDRSKPILREPGLDDDGGRGLRLVDLLATAWGCHGDEAGGSVWFRVAAPTVGDRMETPVDKPDVIFDRDREWAVLSRFVTDPRPGATLGVVSGRRRHGKTFLLHALCTAMGGFYFGATDATSVESLRRIGAALTAYGSPGAPCRFTDWCEAVDALLDLGRDRPVPVVIDEFPYLARAEPALPGIIQRALRGDRSRTRLLPCGSTARHLLAEEPELRDPGMYHAVLAAVAEGNSTRSGMARYLGRKRARTSRIRSTSWKAWDCSAVTRTSSGTTGLPSIRISWAVPLHGSDTASFTILPAVPGTRSTSPWQGKGPSRPFC